MTLLEVLAIIAAVALQRTLRQRHTMRPKSMERGARVGQLATQLPWQVRRTVHLRSPSGKLSPDTASINDAVWLRRRKGEFSPALPYNQIMT